MATILARVAYDGTDFAGYQVQRGLRTVQAELERALAELHGSHLPVAAAGRTDSGVHADGQYISFTSDHTGIPPHQWAAAINSRLPKDVAVLHSRAVPDGFHARYNARSRHYRYRITVGEFQLPHLRRYFWRVRHAPDLVRMNRECAALVGEHDFTTFAARREADESMIRTVLYAHASGRGSQIEFEIGADGFLWHMVRSIVGTLVEREQQRARGRSPDPTIREALAARDRTLAGTTAPAWGLFLHDVEYDL